MNTHVDLEIAKMLNENGFDVPCVTDFKYYGKYSAPTIAETVMWLYENHRIWIVVNVGKAHLAKSCMFYANVIKFGLHHKNKHRTKFTNLPTEAYQEAIKYCLTNIL
jgi:hypothetical protein